ncbi:MAG: nicotinate-nucleotide adenylyltransferase [Tannerella sp.]|jgi:nicotinate-nucleotide adenylyltransferase|nr:nicotinate-nucleotide adenylyltransferase [Tannerella sp.]
MDGRSGIFSAPPGLEQSGPVGGSVDPETGFAAEAKRVGIFSGSFNPVHIGHLALANWLCEYDGTDEIWFLVTPQNPLKETKELMDFRRRFEWVRKAVAGYPKFRVSDFESTLPRPSYTVRTLRALRASFPDCLFHLIVGADNWENITQWKDAEALLAEFPLHIYPRRGYDPILPSPPAQVRMVQAPLLEISSSFIREALGQGKDIRFFLPEAIRNEINQLKKMI